MSMKVWVDQDLCTGSQACAKRLPQLFTMRDGIAFVQQSGAIVGEGGSDALASVPDEDLDAAIEVADECEGQCIFLEPA